MIDLELAGYYSNLRNIAKHDMDSSQHTMVVVTENIES